jgi:hypothetical protein
MPRFKLPKGGRAAGYVSKKPNGSRPSRTLILSVSSRPRKKR